MRRSCSPTDPEKAPDEPVEVVVGFEAGLPVSLDGKAHGSDRTGRDHRRDRRAHGFGRIDMVENRLVGIKSREVYEEAGVAVAHHGAPRTRRPDSDAGTAALQDRHRPAHDGAHLRRSLVQPAGRRAARLHRREPEVRHRRGAAALLQGIAAVRSVGARPIRSTIGSLATYGSGDTFSHQSAKGFIELWGLPVEVWARKHAGELCEPTSRAQQGGGTRQSPGAGASRRAGAALRAPERVHPVRPRPGALRHPGLAGARAHAGSHRGAHATRSAIRSRRARPDRSRRWRRARSAGLCPTRTSTWPSSGGSPNSSGPSAARCTPAAAATTR